MYFIVGKNIDSHGDLLSYIVSDGNNIAIAHINEICSQFKCGNLPMVDSIDMYTGEIHFKNIDNKLLPTYDYDKLTTNTLSVLKIYHMGEKQIGVKILTPKLTLSNIRISVLKRLLDTHNIKLFNVKIVDGVIVPKFGKLPVEDVLKLPECITFEFHEITDEIVTVKVNSATSKYQYMTVTRGGYSDSRYNTVSRTYTVLCKDGSTQIFNESDNVSSDLLKLKKLVVKFINKNIMLEYTGFIPRGAYIYENKPGLWTLQIGPARHQVESDNIQHVIKQCEKFVTADAWKRGSTQVGSPCWEAINPKFTLR